MHNLHITHPNEQQTRDLLALDEYKYLGYQNGWKHVYFDADGNETEDKSIRRTFGYRTSDYPDYGACREAKHQPKSVQHNPRGSNVTYYCPDCRIFWKVDMSD